MGNLSDSVMNNIFETKQLERKYFISGRYKSQKQCKLRNLKKLHKKCLTDNPS